MSLENKNFDAIQASQKRNILDEKLLVEKNAKDSLHGIEADFIKNKKPTFQEQKKSILSKSIDFNEEEKKLTDLEKKKLFRGKYIESLKEAKSSRNQQIIIAYIYRGQDPENIDQKVVLEKLKAINQLLALYKITNPADILDSDPKIINKFADDFSKIVGISSQELIKEWIEIRKEDIEIEKLKKLIASDKVLDEIYDKTINGEEVDYTKLYEDHKDILKDEARATEELVKKENEIKKPEDTYFSTLQPAEKEKIQIILNESTTSIKTFEEVMSFFDNTVDPATLEVNGGNISFVVFSPQGLSIPVRIDKNEIILLDSSEEIRLKTDDKEAYKLESEIFEIKNELKKMEEYGGKIIPKDLRKFFFSRDLAKFVDFISIYRARIAGNSDNNRTFEVRKVYEYLLKLPHEQQWKLDKDIEKAKGDKEIKDMAIKLQKEIR